MERIELRLIQMVVLREFSIEPLDCLEILPLVGVVQRFAEKKVL